MSTPPTDTGPDLAQRLVLKAEIDMVGAYNEQHATGRRDAARVGQFCAEARAAVVAVLRVLETSGVFDPQDSAVLDRLAEKIEENRHA